MRMPLGATSSSSIHTLMMVLMFMWLFELEASIIEKRKKFADVKKTPKSVPQIFYEKKSKNKRSPAHLHNSSHIMEYCENENFTAKCPVGHAILITHALYGRMNAGKCLQVEASGCSKDVTSFMEWQCASKNECSMPVSSLINHQPPTCRRDLRSYLETAYTCVDGGLFSSLVLFQTLVDILVFCPKKK